MTTEDRARPADPLAALPEAERNAIEAAVFRRLLAHLDERTDVQNIDLMNLAGFCRNCLSKWYAAAAADHGQQLDYEAARARVYGMPYGEWKDRYQTDASPTQLASFADSQAKSH
jgi:hypothetical protein